MDATLQQLRIIWGALLTSMVLYLFLGERLPHTSREVSKTLFEGFALIYVSVTVAIFAIRIAIISKATGKLAAESEDAGALAQWRFGHIIVFALCESIALFGFVLRFSGSTLPQAGVFYLAGLVLMVFLMPRRPVQSLGE